MTEIQKYVETLVKKAAEVADSKEAMNFSQAALNAANALCSLDSVPELKDSLHSA